jgi:hypothetical protein
MTMPRSTAFAAAALEGANIRAAQRSTSQSRRIPRMLVCAGQGNVCRM